MRYNNGFKARMVRRMTGPDAISANALSKEVGIRQPTLSRWLRDASTVSASRETFEMANAKKNARSTRQWSAAEKFRVIREAASLSQDDLGAFLRREGLHEAQLEEWCAQAQAALAPPRPKKASPEAKLIRALEKDLRRKEKALAEVTALLTLQKKVREIWGDEDDDTAGMNGI